MPNASDSFPNTSIMNSIEKRAATSLASLYALRMLGLFMVLPVMMEEGQKLEGATVSLLGLAMGIYGLTQALLQIPAGTLSDRFGRKPIIVGGLIIFAIGSIIAASADTIWMMLFGRALQGAGAIASAIMALLTDLTREEHRMKAMATVGVSIGLSFSVALVLGPWLASIGGLPLIFGLTAALAIGGVFVVLFAIPTPPKQTHRDSIAVWSEVLVQIRNRELWPLNTGIFLLHALMVAIFVAIPKELSTLGVAAEYRSWVYLPTLLVAFVLMVPFIIIAEKKKHMKGVVISGAGIIALSLLMMVAASELWHWIIAMMLYFWGFNLMEASLPSWLSKVAPAGAKGSAMGVYSTMQFLGAFVGGGVGGWLYSQYGSDQLFLAFAVLIIIWLLLLSFSPAPKYLTSVRLEASSGCSETQLAQLKALAGVAEVNQLSEEGAVYLKVNADTFDYQRASAIIQA